MHALPAAHRAILWTGLWVGALLWGVSCGDSLPDSRPPSRSGAFADQAPDVLVLALPRASAAAWDDAAALQDVETGIGYWASRGVVMDAAYTRFHSAEQNRGDVATQGSGEARVAALPAGDLEPTAEGTWLAAFQAKAYRIHANLNANASETLAWFETSEEPSVAVIEAPVEAADSLGAWLDGYRGFLDGADKRPRLLLLYALEGEPKAAPLTEARLRIPILFAASQGIDRGERRPTVITLADVGPTLLDLCGLLPEGQRASDLDGSSFARVLIKEPIAWRGFGLALAPDGSAWARSARWRLIRYADGRELLSQVDTDPRRMDDDRAVPGAVAQFRGLGARIDQWLGSR